ncbi:NAD(P)-dependent oxidoreductase [Cryobacterium lactosi]|uniref:NAD(P)-dependent oxidoreductase n=1 Tax=Cryobacterium lactosi TaxID=1259202 RepID=A0A4R9BQV4_9MICO|nr:NAD(P)-dependent oxidoreductase [Cryobacterium lactosi]TFD88069.1 NAD(P)-dependent oxidoreductase [Cryobacterium lactosi]
MNQTQASGQNHPSGHDYTVAVLGLGAMGLPMATRLASALSVHGFDISQARLDLAADAGIEVFDSAQGAAAGADAVLLAVRNGDQLRDVLFGENGISDVLSPGSVVIMTSTVGIDDVTAVAHRLAGHGVQLVDAPLSGGPVRAGQGDLLIVVGADPTARTKAQPVLDLLASTLSVIGDKPGDGQAFKTVNQLLCGVHIAVAAEALALAGALGLNVESTLATLSSGAAGSFMLANRGPRMLEAYTEDGAEVLSRLDIFVKDMGIVTKAARGLGLATPVASAAEQVYLLGQAAGLAAADDSAVIKVVAPQATA